MLRLYPHIPHRRLTALVQDAAFLLVLALLSWIGLRVHDTVDKLAVLGHGVKEIGDNVPLVGGPVKDLASAARTTSTTSRTCSAWSRS